MWTCLVAVALLGAAPELTVNGGFDDGLNGWTVGPPQVSMDAAQIDGRSVARVRVPETAPVAYYALRQELPAEPGLIFELRADVRAQNVRDGYGAYLALEFHNAGGRISYGQSDPLTGDAGWTERVVRTVAPPGTKTAQIALLVHGHGEGLFDNVRLTSAGSVAPEPLDGPVTIAVTQDVVCGDFIGFGFEDDGWLYNPDNAARGVTEEDYALKESRVAWMDPDHVRMFFWIQDYCPSGDWETFTFDSPNMRSKYRTLDTYQRLGTDVNVTGVEWGVKGPYDDVDKAARGIGALFEHLIRKRGYTCVKYWTLTNEPNGGWNRQWTGTQDAFDGYVELHRKVKAEFARRGLDVKVVGSDDTSGFEWFKRCVDTPAYFETADLFSSHRYMPYADRALAPFFFRERLDLLASKTPRKPLVIEEFGFQDPRSGTLENPIMMTYPYAVWTASFCIDGLNMGVAGFSIWALHEVYYPGNAFMEYALWEFKDDAWKVRPVYHAVADFCRLTERGDKVYRCESSSPAHVAAARVGDTLFWVNRSDQAVEVAVAGFAPKEARIHTADNLEGDRESGAVRPVGNSRFTAPPMSFGYAR